MVEVFKKVDKVASTDITVTRGPVEPDPTLDAAAAAELPRPAGVVGDPVFDDGHRILEFERLGLPGLRLLHELLDARELGLQRLGLLGQLLPRLSLGLALVAAVGR